MAWRRVIACKFILSKVMNFVSFLFLLIAKQNSITKASQVLDNASVYKKRSEKCRDQSKNQDIDYYLPPHFPKLNSKNNGSNKAFKKAPLAVV